MHGNYKIQNHLNTSDYWTIGCLRSKSCLKTIDQPIGTCKEFLRCSKCNETSNEYTCQISGKCIQTSQICDGKIDCDDETDELGCDGLVLNYFSFEFTSFF